VKGRYIDISSIPRLRAGEAHIRSVFFHSFYHHSSFESREQREPILHLASLPFLLTYAKAISLVY